MIRLSCCDCGSTDFPKVRRKKKLASGRYTESVSARCIVCFRENQRLAYERKKQDPIRYQAHLKANRDWQKNNPDKARKTQLDWEIRNRERRQMQKHEYYLEHKTKILAQNKKWKDANRKPKGTGNKNHVWRRLEQGRIDEVIQKRKGIHDTTATKSKTR